MTSETAHDAEEELAASEITWIRAELGRRFAGGGCCMARASDFARFFPGVRQEQVEEALHQMWKEHVVEMDCLSDGSFVFYFPPREFGNAG